MNFAALNYSVPVRRQFKNSIKYVVKYFIKYLMNYDIEIVDKRFHQIPNQVIDHNENTSLE